MRTAVPGVAALILIFVTLAEGVAAEQGVPAAVSEFYKNRAFCSVARVADVVADPEGVAVHLGIDRRWRDVLARKPDVRQRWFGIHCPPPQHPLWSALGDGRDIIIHGRLGDAAPYRLSCRASLAQRWGARQRDDAEWADWYSALRRRLGLDGTR